MSATRLAVSIASLLLVATAAPIGASEHGSHEVCTGFGPQTPRDIDSLHGENARVFPLAPDREELNLCNIHFHANAEHKARDFALYAGSGKDGYGSGYRCAMGESLTADELRAPATQHCKGIAPGDTIEVHWVHSSCAVTPGPGLGSCLSDSCANPSLRVEAQVFTLVNDPAATDFADLAYGGNLVNGLHQAKSIPDDTGAPVEFLGSTTGPSFDEQTCSPLQVSWSVRPHCAKLDINSLSAWCEDNVFGEESAHGVRQLVTNPALLAPID